jgi:flagellar protein FlgJ
MISPVAPRPTNDARTEQLRHAVQQLESVFVQQLFKAMRETVPRDGMTNGGTGEEMFTGMLDEALASAVPPTATSSLTEALMRQLRPRLGETDAKTSANGSDV